MNSVRTKLVSGGLCLLLASVVAGLSALPVADACAHPLHLRVVAISGDSASSARTADRFKDFESEPVIDDMGRVAFLATLEDLSSRVPSFQSGVWVESDQGLRIAAATGAPAPATGANFATFSDLVMTDSGSIAFKAILRGDSVYEETCNSVWQVRDGSLQLIAQAGREAPHRSIDMRFSNFEAPIALNGNGQAVVYARMRAKEESTTIDSGMWFADSDKLLPIAAAGDLAVPGSSAMSFQAQSFESPFADDPVISPTGQTVFRGFVDVAGGDGSNRNGLWSYHQSTGLRPLAIAGEQAIGMGDMKFVSFPGIPTINAAGDTAFLAFYADDRYFVEIGNRDQRGNASNLSDARSSNASPMIGLGLWLRRATGEFEQIFAIGDVAPGIAEPSRFIDTFDPVMNAASRVAFLAAVREDGTNSATVGLWSNGMSSDANLQLIARQGDHAPGNLNDFVFGTFFEPSLNAHGQTAFMASAYRLQADKIIDSALGVWGQDRSGQLRLVAQTGQLVEVRPGEFREIASLAFTSESGGEDGKPRGLNDSGLIALRATFTDGTSGIFVSNVLAIPEPRSLMLTIMAACICWLQIRSRAW